MECLLCNSSGLRHLHQRIDPVYGKRDYWECSQCRFVFLDPQQRITEEAEIEVYKKHRNSLSDAGYVDFLNRLAKPVLQKLEPRSHGLDFGSGPGPTLNILFEREGHSVDLYDPFFHPDERVFQKKYDFITSSEVFEHLFNPLKVIEKLATLLKPNGIIGIMTEFRSLAKGFEQWWYLRDPSHVCFYSEKTLEWIANHKGWQLDVPRKNICIFF